MRVLWLCNVMLPAIAEQWKLEASNKEGWLSGLASVTLRRQGENGIELAVAFPAPEALFSAGQKVCRRVVTLQGVDLTCYGFRENTRRPDVYDEALEGMMREITDAFRPDVVHCFGTEYPHTLAMCRAFPAKDRLLIGIQGLCAPYAEAYFADMPDKAIKTVTLRDFLRRDSLLEQQGKFVRRGKMEKEAVTLAGNVTGRTAWDRFYTKEWNPKARYFEMNETLRRDFYGTVWSRDACEAHSIFISQGDYPLKGLHYVLKALPAILAVHPDAKVYVAGNCVVRYGTLKQKLKLSGYGKYLRKLIRENGLQGKVVFLGRLDSARMKEQYLRSHLYVCCSALENSPNSLGEAMLLGMPCVSADVGGIPSIFTDGEDGILFEGFRSPEDKFHNTRTLNFDGERALELISQRLAGAVLKMWEEGEKAEVYCRNARKHAEKTHDGDRNYSRMTEIYAEISARSEERIEE